MWGKYRILAAQKTEARGFTEDPVTLALGVCEEAGELGKAVNWYHNPLYVHSPHTEKNPPDDDKHEVEDLLIYLASLCNALDIDVEF